MTIEPSTSGTPANVSAVAPSVAPKPADLLRMLPMKYIGHVSIVGECFCFGLAVEYVPSAHRLYPVYLNIAGAATSVEAVWARLVQGKELTITPLQQNTSAIYLHPPEKALYNRLQSKIDGLGMDNLVLMHKSLVQPNFAEDALAFIMALEYQGACLRLVDVISKTVKIAVFPAWGDYLRKQGYSKGLVTPRKSYEGVEFWTVKLDAVAWTGVIANGLQTRSLKLP